MASPALTAARNSAARRASEGMPPLALPELAASDYCEPTHGGADDAGGSGAEHACDKEARRLRYERQAQQRQAQVRAEREAKQRKLDDLTLRSVWRGCARSPTSPPAHPRPPAPPRGSLHRVEQSTTKWRRRMSARPTVRGVWCGVAGRG